VIFPQRKKKKKTRPGRTKYNTRPARCHCTAGHNHDSRVEAQHCNRLAARLAAGRIADYKTQKRFDLVVNGRLVGRHYVDFLIEQNDGTQSIVEVKSPGTVTEIWKLKRALTEVLFPHIPYTVAWYR